MEGGYIKRKSSKKIPLEKELWIEKIARITYAEQLGRKLTGKDGLGPYIFQWIFQIVVIAVLPIIAFIQFRFNLWFVGPIGLVVVLFGVTYAVWATKKFRSKYYETISLLRKNRVISDSKFYSPITPMYIKFTVLFLGLAGLLLRIIYVEIIPILQNPSLIGNPSADNYSMFSFGLIRGILLSLIWILVYLPLLAEFAALFFGIHIFLPLKFKERGLKFNFSDPQLFGGMGPIGNLFKQSAGIYFIGLTVYLIATISAQYRFGPISIAFFVGGWILGFVLFFLPQLTIHKQMKQAKQTKLKEIGKNLMDATPDNMKKYLKYLYLHTKYNYAEKMKTYPFDVSTIKNLMLTASIPISAEVIIRIYFHYLGM